MPGIGWAMTFQDPGTGWLSNHFVTLHENGVPAGFRPILVLDGWEHAFMRDYKAFERAKYVEAFFKNVDWAAVESRLEVARLRRPPRARAASPCPGGRRGRGTSATWRRASHPPRRGSAPCAGACSPGGTPATATSPGASRSAPPTPTGSGSPR